MKTMSVFPETTLTFWDKSRLVNMNIQAIQQDFASIFLATASTRGVQKVLS